MKKTRVGALRKRNYQEGSRISRDKQEHLSSHNFRCSFSSIGALQTHRFHLLCSLPCSNLRTFKRLCGGAREDRFGRVSRSLILVETFPPLAQPMSSNNFRDFTVVIIETGRTTVRAGQSLHDLLRLPTIVPCLHFNPASATA